MKRAQIVLLLLLVLGGVAYLLSGPDSAGTTEAIERTDDDSEAEPRDPITLQGRGEARPTEAAEDPDASSDEEALEGESEARPTRRLEGLVTDEQGVPVADVRVRLVSSASWVLSDYGGTFVFDELPEERVSLTIEPGGDWLPVRPISVAPDESFVRIRLQRGTSMRIFVLGADGTPAANAPFRVAGMWASTESDDSLGGLPVGHTDEEGVFVVRGIPPGGLLELHVGGNKWPDVRFLDVPIDRDKRTLRLPAPAVLEGILVDEDGLPLGGIGMAADGCEPHVWHMNRKTETDVETGRFCFDMLAPGRYRLDVTAPEGYAEQHELRFVHAPREGMRVQLARRVRVSGTVHADDPSKVSVFWCAGGRRELRTPDESGDFTYGSVPDIPGTLYACDGAFENAYLLEAVRPSEGPFTFRLLPASTVRGTVPGFAAGRHGPILIGLRRGPLLIEGELHGDDTFEILCVPPGTWTIELWEDGGCVRVEDVEAGTQDIVVRLPPPSDAESD